MGGYRKTSHSVYDIKYHVVWITKYRKPVLSKDVGRRLRELIRQVCTGMDIQIIKGHVSRDHVHMMVSVLPYISVSDMMKRIKGRASYKLLNEYRGLKKPRVLGSYITLYIIINYMLWRGLEPPRP